MRHLIVVGVSLGGLHALQTLLGGLPAHLPAAIAVAQHRSASGVSPLVSLLRVVCALPVREPHDKEKIRPGTVYIAPADYHLLIEDSHFALTTEAPVLYARPSIDVLFESAAASDHARVIGIVLTGASSDGTRGARVIRESGGIVIVQSPSTAECAFMPQSVIQAGLADHILPLLEIAGLLIRLLQNETEFSESAPS